MLGAISKRFDTIVEFSAFENFAKVIDRAKLACQNSGRNIEDDFAEVSKIVEAGALIGKENNIPIVNEYKREEGLEVLRSYEF